MNDYDNKRQKQREATETKIIEAAIRLFGKAGYVKTSIKEIAEEADVAVGLVGKYFPTKEFLLTAAYRHATVCSYPLSSDNLSARECALVLVRHTVEIYRNKPEYYRFFRTMLTASDLPQEYTDARREFFHYSTVYPHILQEQEKGHLPEEDPHGIFIEYMRMVFNMVEVFYKMPSGGDNNAAYKAIELVMKTVQDSLR